MATRKTTSRKPKARTTAKRRTYRRSTRVAGHRASRSGLSGTAVDDATVATVQARWLERGMWAAVAIGVLGGGYLLTKKVVNEVIIEPKRIKSVNESVNVGTPAYFASQLDLAFHPSGSKTIDDWFGDGTDEKQAIAMLRAIPNRATYEQMLKEYSTLTSGRKFGDDLRNELTSVLGNEDYALAQQIISKLYQ